MSAFSFPGGVPKEIVKNITSTSATDIAGDAAVGRIGIVWLQIAEIAGATPTVSLYRYDANSGPDVVQTVYLFKNRVLDAGELVEYAEGIILTKNQFLRIVSSAANQVDVYGLAVSQQR